MSSKITGCAGVFFLLFMLFFPLDFLGNSQRKVSLFLFGGLTEWISGPVFGTRNLRIDFSSDSISMVVFIGILLMISALVSLVSLKQYSRKFSDFSKEAVVLYLVVILMKYGFDKIFKAQFYLPEPNILFSRFGNLDRDILFWSTMGTSRSYSLFSGGTELLAAVLLLFLRTRVLGLLISTGIFINILAINIGFDISVKLFSLLLLLMGIFALKDDWIPLFRFLILKKETQLAKEEIRQAKLQPARVFLKTALLGWAGVIILFPYFNAEVFNDDKAERPFFHGAFKNMDENSEVEYIFFHRDHYLIFMDKKEKMRDFHYVSGSEDLLFLEDDNGGKIHVKVSYQKKDSLLTLKWGNGKIQAKELNWKKMNALKPLFHTVTEQVK